MVKAVFCLDTIFYHSLLRASAAFCPNEHYHPEQHLTLAPNAHKFLVTGLQTPSNVTALPPPSTLERAFILISFLPLLATLELNTTLATQTGLVPL